MRYVKAIFFALSFMVCLLPYQAGLLAAPPSASIYQLSSPYNIVLPGQRVFLRAYFGDSDFGESYDVKWDFGDGTTAGDTIKTSHNGYANPGRCTPYRYGCFSYITTSYSYKRPGTYKITLTVVDSRSERGEDFRILKVVSAGDTVKKLLTELDAIPAGAFTIPGTKDNLVRALGLVDRNLGKAPAAALDIIKEDIIPMMSGPRVQQRFHETLAESVHLAEALAGFLLLEH